MSLLEHEATRMAAALDDYEHVGVTDIGGTDESGFWIEVTDERFGLDYEIDSHADYWDFIGYFADGKQSKGWFTRTPLTEGCKRMNLKCDSGAATTIEGSTRIRTGAPCKSVLVICSIQMTH